MKYRIKKSEEIFDRIMSVGYDPSKVRLGTNKNLGRWNLLFDMTNHDVNYWGQSSNLCTTELPLEVKKGFYRDSPDKITEGHLKMAKKILEAGIDINAIHVHYNSYDITFKPTTKLTVLSQAVAQSKKLENDSLVRFFLENGADYRQKVCSRSTLTDKRVYYACLGSFQSHIDQEQAVIEFEKRYEKEIESGKLARENNKNKCFIC